MAQISLHDFMEDFDNAELSDYEWREQMEDAVRDYNQEYDTEYNPTKEVEKYKRRKFSTS